MSGNIWLTLEITTVYLPGISNILIRVSKIQGLWWGIRRLNYKDGNDCNYFMVFFQGLP